ncbi:MAG: SRPBCC domain-containing protein [bacterium]|nr:SRPBCC domain-containing protein [bacterium]
MTTKTVMEDSLVVETDIAAAPERVFRALTDPQEVVKWWGAKDLYQTESWESDLRPAGAWKGSGTNADGRPFEVKGKFLEVDPPRLLSFTWEPSWDEWQLDTPTTVRIELTPTAEGTHIKLIHSGFAGHQESLQGHQEGWPRVLGWLGGHLA